MDCTLPVTPEPAPTESSVAAGTEVTLETTEDREVPVGPPAAFVVALLFDVAFTTRNTATTTRTTTTAPLAIRRLRRCSARLAAAR
jgi:hypothetical protein